MKKMVGVLLVIFLCSLFIYKIDRNFKNNAITIGQCYSDLSFLPEDQQCFWNNNKQYIDMFLYNVPKIEKLYYDKGIDTEICRINEIEYVILDINYLDFKKDLLTVITEEFFDSYFSNTLQIVEGKPAIIHGDGGFAQPQAIIYTANSIGSKKCEIRIDSLFWMEETGISLNTNDTEKIIAAQKTCDFKESSIVTLIYTENKWKISNIKKASD